MYDENHNGLQLDAAESDVLQNDKLLQGFLSKTDLDNLLSQPDCVGVRIYNAVAVAPDANSRIIAVGVRQNGSEIRPSGLDHLLSQLFDPNGQASAGTPTSLMDAGNRVTIPPGNQPRQAVQFSSFFSRSMLEALLADIGGVAVEGVGFHKTTTSVGNEDFFTHTGVPYLRIMGQLQMADSSYLKSDQPCPGVCAKFVSPPTTNLAMATAPTEVVPFTSDSNIYLLRW